MNCFKFPKIYLEIVKGNQRNLPFWLFTCAIFIVLIIPVLLKDGMFMDGLQYACISNNLANGLGTFWAPFLSAIWWKSGSNLFLEHPPLVYGIQSVFFRIFGDGIYTERMYSLLTAVISAYLIAHIWRLFFRQNESLKALAWLPVLFWICIPVCFWSYQNNMLENTVSVFTLTAVYFCIKAIIIQRTQFVFAILSGVFVFFASFSKGVVGLFPIAVFGLSWFLLQRNSLKGTVFFFLLQVSSVIIIYLMLLNNQEAFQSFSFYFQHRLLYRIQEEPVVTSRFFILFRLLGELVPIALLTGVMVAIIKSKTGKWRMDKDILKSSLFFISIGFAGSLPLMLTLVQRGFYLVPSLPFFAIGFSILLAPGLSVLIGKLDIKSALFWKLKIACICLLIVVILFSGLQFGKVGRDKDILHDIYVVGKVIPKGEVMGINNSLSENWSLQFYLIRHFNISLTAANANKKYLLVDKKEAFRSQKEYQKIESSTRLYDVYKIEDKK